VGTGLGTSKSTIAVRVPSEATPDKRDMFFDLISHNPKVARSNRAPATMGAARLNLKAPFFLSVAENTMFTSEFS
jgi:hypothetical protein